MANKNIWGTICDCKEEVYDFYDEHPWLVDENIVKKIKCPKCKKEHLIDSIIASEFYNNKIYECFNDVKGRVLEIGSGGGLITEYLLKLEDVNYVATVDIDEESISEISNKHYTLNLNHFDETIFMDTYDYVVCRDVLMYLDDLDYTFSKLSKISNKVILLNWHDINHKNCLNKTQPEEILKILEKYYKDLIIEYPPFYKNGYLIKSKYE